jgi:hypothetical protein
MPNSFQAFLTGCSAGGLATFIHCDNFRTLLPKDSRVKCLADGGFFLDVYVSKSPLHVLCDFQYFFHACMKYLLDILCQSEYLQL